MNKILLFLCVLLFATLGCVEIPEPFSKIPPGLWKGTLVLEDDPLTNRNDLELPFNFEVNYGENDAILITIINAEERIVIEEVKFTHNRRTGRDSIFIDFPLFDTHIAAEFKENIIQGAWHVHYRDNYSIPFIAYHGNHNRFEMLDDANHDLSGEWNVRMEIETETEYPALGDFKQEGNKLTGTFLTETGDYRYLEGVVSGNELFLSCFDGSHAFYFDGEVLNSGSILGRFYSGVHYKTNWTGVKDGNNDMSNAYEFSKLKRNKDPVSFSFPNTEGLQVSLSDEKYRDKPKIIKLMGTWCPNCMDETNFLLDYLKNNPDKQIDIIAIAFERYRDPQKALQMVEQYKTKKQIPYEVLYGGYYDKAEATETFKILEKIQSYPTLIFLNSKNEVQKIYTGFAGPATKEYQNFKVDFDRIVTELLNEV